MRKTTAVRLCRTSGQSTWLAARALVPVKEHDTRRTRFWRQLVHDGRYGQVTCGGEHAAILGIGAHVRGSGRGWLWRLLLGVRRRRLCSRIRVCGGIPPRPLPPGSPTFDLFPVCLQDRFTNPTWALDGVLAHKWTGHFGWGHRMFERVDGHKLVIFAHLLGDARAPVLDLDKDAFAVVVSRVADVEGETGVPVWGTGATADVTCGELAGNLLDHVFDGVVGKMACGTVS